MASSVTSAALNAVIADVGPQYMAEAVTRFSTLWDIIPKRPFSDVKGPRWMVKTAGNTSAAQYTPGGSLGSPGAATFSQAQMNWGNYVATLSFNERQFAQLNLQADPSRYLVSMVDEQLKDQSIGVASVMNTASISGSDTTDGIIGVCTAIDDTGTYANIDRGVATEFACYVADNSGSGRTLTVAIMDTAYDYFLNTIKADPGQWVILTGSAQASTMRGFSTGAVTSNVVSLVNPGGMVGDVWAAKVLSYAKMYYRELPIITIPGYTAGRIDFVNLNGLEYEVLSDDPEMPFRYDEVERDGDLYIFKVYCNAQLTLKNPKHNAFSIQDLS